VSTLSWVIGRGGLLGSSVERAISAPVWHPNYLFPWHHSSQLRDAIADSVQRFRVRLLSENVSSWNIYWCAGAGVVGTSAEQFAAETSTLRFFLDQFGDAIGDFPPDVSGQIFLASSAGGVYGGSTDRPLTERTVPHPISDYGRAKLEHELILSDWARTRPNVSTLVGRLSNLYGPGQHIEKPQGLISHMSRCLIFSVPVRIFVPLDTIRDYLFVDDAAHRMVAGMKRLRREAPSGGQHITKIFGSGSETTVAGLIGVFRQIAKRHLRLISAQSAVRSQQPAALQFRSVVWPEEPCPPRTELLDGVNRVHNHQLALFQTGRLAPPWSRSLL
jgi:NAD dependent epimerase/dehydratase family